MPAMTDYLENKLLDFLLRGQSYTPPSTLYFALFSTETTETGAGTEFFGSGYGRVAVSANTSSFSGTQAIGSTDVSSGDSGQTSNNEAVTFPVPVVSWGTATHLGIFDASTGGNMLFYGELTVPKLISAGSAPKFPIASVVFTLDASS